MAAYMFSGSGHRFTGSRGTTTVVRGRLAPKYMSKAQSYLYITLLIDEGTFEGRF